MADQNRGIFLFINEQEVSAQLERATQRAQSLEQKLAGIGDKTSPEFLKIQKQLEATTSKIDKLSQQVTGKYVPSMRQLQTATQKAWNELNNLPIGSPAWKAKLAEFDNLNQKLIGVKTQVNSVGKVFDSFATRVKEIALGVFVGNTVSAVTQTLTSSLTNFIGGASKISDEFSDIEKTTNLTTKQVRELNSELGKIDTRTPTSQLRELGTTAGKLGKEGTENIRTFVKEADQIVVSLGEDVGDAVTQIAKEADIFKLGMLNIASGINSVGQASSANEAYLTEFLFRTASTGKTAKIAAGDLLGYGAALDINGAQLEASSTAIQTFFIEFVKNTEKFGKAAGFAKGELQKLVDAKGVNEGFLQFLKRLKDTSTSSDVLLKKLEALGIDGARGANAFLTLSQNIELVRQQQDLANKAIAEGTSITEEFEKRNNNFAGTVAKISKEWNKLTASSAIQDFLKSGAEVTLQFVRALAQLPAVLNNNRNAIQLLLLVLVLFYRQKIANTIATVANTVAETYNAFAKRASAFATGVAATATAVYSLAVGVLTGEVSASAAAVILFNHALTLLASSLGAIVAIVAAVVVAFKLYYENTGKAAEFETKRTQTSGELTKALRELEAEQTKLNESIAKYNTLNQQQRDALRDTLNSDIDKYTKKLEEIKKKQQDLRGSGTPTAFQFALNLVASAGTAGVAVNNMTDGIENGQKAAEALQPQIDKLSGKLKELKEAANAIRTAMELYNDAMQIVGLTAEDLESKLGILEKALKRALNPAEIKLISDEIAKVKKQLAALNLDVIDDKKAKEQLDKYRKLLDDIAKLKREYEFSLISDDAAELQRLKDKYDEILERAKGHNEQLLLIQQLYEFERQALVKKQFASEADRGYKTELNALATFYNLKRVELKSQYAQGLIDEEDYQNGLIAIDVSSKQAMLYTAEGFAKDSKAAAADEAQFAQDLDNAVLDEHIRVNGAIENSDEAAAAKAKALRKKERQEAIENFQAIAQVASSLFEGLANLSAQLAQKQIDQNNKVFNEEKDKLQQQLDAKLISQEEYNSRVDEITKKQRDKERKIKREQFVKDKAAKISEAIINTAVAVTANLESIPLAVLAGITGALQIALIAAEPVPEFGKGGKVKGKSHAQGGVPILAEGSEWIINKSSSTKYDPLLQAINRDDTALINKWYRQRPALNLTGLINPAQPGAGSDTATYNDERLRKTIHNGFLAHGQYIVNGVVTGIAHSSYAGSRKL